MEITFDGFGRKADPKVEKSDYVDRYETTIGCHALCVSFVSVNQVENFGSFFLEKKKQHTFLVAASSIKIRHPKVNVCPKRNGYTGSNFARLCPLLFRFRDVVITFLFHFMRHIHFQWFISSIVISILFFFPPRPFADILYDVPVGIIVLLSIFYGSISIIAVIGNSLVIWIVATTRQMQTVTNLFIANLALADVVIGMFVIPFQVIYNHIYI